MTPMPMQGQGITNPISAEIRLLFPWLPEPLVQVYTDAYIETGNPDLAWATVRQSEVYDTYFAGNRRDDGTLRYAEAEYMAVRAAYREVFITFGLNPEIFEERHVELIEGDVAPDELFGRIEPVWERVIESSESIRAEFTRRNGFDITDEAIIAGLIDPEMDQKIVERKISVAEIAGEAVESGFGLSDDQIDRLLGAGIGREQADVLFSTAENVVPVLGTLARRHSDPDDDFDINEFLSADVWADPRQRMRMRRLVAQEKSLFGNIGAQTSVARRNLGQMSGLAQF